MYILRIIPDCANISLFLSHISLMIVFIPNNHRNFTALSGLLLLYSFLMYYFLIPGFPCYKTQCVWIFSWGTGAPWADSWVHKTSQQREHCILQVDKASQAKLVDCSWGSFLFLQSSQLDLTLPTSQTQSTAKKRESWQGQAFHV